MSALQPRHAGEDRAGAGVAWGTGRNILSCRAALQTSAGTWSVTLSRVRHVRGRRGLTAEGSLGPLSNIRSWLSLWKLCFLQYLKVHLKLRPYITWSFFTIISPSLHTLFPQVLSPKLGETRVFQLNCRISLNFFFLNLYSEMVEVVVWNLHTKNVNVLRGIYKLKVPWGAFI